MRGCPTCAPSCGLACRVFASWSAGSRSISSARCSIPAMPRPAPVCSRSISAMRDRPRPVRRRRQLHGRAEGDHGIAERGDSSQRGVRPDGARRAEKIRRLQGRTWAMTDTLIPEGFRKLDVADEFVGLIGPLWFKAEGETLRVGLPLEPRHGNPMGWAHGGLLVTLADMVMGAGSGHATGIRWPHPTISLSTEFVRGARLGQWLEGTARIARRTLNFCFCSCDLVCGGEIVLVASGVFKVPDVDKIPEAMRAKVLGKWGDP